MITWRHSPEGYGEGRDGEWLEVQIGGAARMHGHLLFDASKHVRMTSSSTLFAAIILNQSIIMC